jgi:hypothetical protein
MRHEMKIVVRKPAQHTAGLRSFLPRKVSKRPAMRRKTPKKSEYLARYSQS